MKEKDFDCYQRYMALKGVLDAAFVDAPGTQDRPVRVLDVGSGPSPLSAEFLGPRYRIVRSDVMPLADPDAVVLTPGAPLPFPDRAFDAVIAMDVLEHVERKARPLFLDECVRVANTLCVIAAPEGSAELEATEARVYAVHKASLGAHAYFEEHGKYGVPTADEVLRELERSCKTIFTFPNVPLCTWEAFSCLDFIAYGDPETRDLSMLAHAIENEDVPPISADQPHYRRFYVVPRSSEVNDSLRDHITRLGPTAATPGGAGMLQPIWRLVAGLCRQHMMFNRTVYEHQVEVSRLNEALRALDARHSAEVTQLKDVHATEVARLVDGLNELQVQLAAAQRYAADQQQALHAVLSSRTWRYTALLRKAANAARGLLRK